MAEVDAYIQLSDQTKNVLSALDREGYEAFVVGGFVRDAVLGRATHDVDITTNALPEQVRRTMQAAGFAVFDTGLKHGTLTVVADGEHMEVTTYRADGPYLDSRHPASVRFSNSLEEDLQRRDFTMNALAYNLRAGLVDTCGGLADVREGLVRCVGEPGKRFQEDALRMLRALRFASELGFSIEKDTAQAVCKHAKDLNLIARERIGAEFTRLICGEGVQSILLDYRCVIGEIIPQLRPEFDFDQRNPHHVFDVWEHSVTATGYIASDPTLRYAALLHDIGKPSTFTIDEQGTGHYYGHAKAGAPIALEVCRSLRLPAELRDEVVKLVGHHDDVLVRSEKNLRRAMRRISPDSVRRLLALKRADLYAHHPRYRKALPVFDEIEELLSELLAQDACTCVKDLAVGGRDVMALGVPQGKRVGEALNALLDKVVDGELPNERDALLAELERGVRA